MDQPGTYPVTEGPSSPDNRPYSPGSYRPETREAATSPADGEGRFGFLMHPLSPVDYPVFDASMRGMPYEWLEEFSARLGGLLAPFLLSRIRVHSRAGRTVYGEMISVPRTSRDFMALEPRRSAAEVREGVRLARDRGARSSGWGPTPRW